MANGLPPKLQACLVSMSFNNNNKSSPKTFGKSASLPPRQRMHSHTAYATVACTMRNKALRSVTALLRNVTEPLRKISILAKTT